MQVELISKDVLDTLQNALENKTEVMGYNIDGTFLIYKKCLVLFNRTDPRFSYDPLEILLPVNTYYLLKSEVEKTGSHYIPESGVHLFFSVVDFWNTIMEAQKNKMF